MRKLQKLNNTHFWLMVFIVFLLLAIGWALLSRCSSNRALKEGFDISGGLNISVIKKLEKKEKFDTSKDYFANFSKFECQVKKIFPDNVSGDLIPVKENLEKTRSDEVDATNAYLEANKFLYKKILNDFDDTKGKFVDYMNGIKDNYMKNPSDPKYGAIFNAFQHMLASSNNFRNLRDKILKQYYSNNIPSTITEKIDLHFKNDSTKYLKEIFPLFFNEDTLAKKDALFLLYKNDKNIRDMGNLNCKLLRDVAQEIMKK